MCSGVAIVLLTASLQARAKEVAGNHFVGTQGSMEKLTSKLADKLWSRGVASAPLHFARLGETTLGKPANLAIRHYPTPLYSRPEVSRSGIASFALGSSRPSPIVQSVMAPPDNAVATNQKASSRPQKFAPVDLTPAVDKFTRLPRPGDMNVGVDFSSDALDSRMASKNVDPFKLMEKDLEPLSEYVLELVQSENPVLTKAASHFFEKRQGKRFRPTIVALMARVLDPEGLTEDQLKRQLQLGQITEMIHVASLIHDDVLDVAETRRGGAAVHAMYTNKVAVLAGDYLLARASMLLARLQQPQVVEVMASALESLVQGEIMQARSKKADLTDMNHYLRKSYFKTASLICNSCKSAALLAGYRQNDTMTVAAEEYGYHLGMAYQIVDDILDFTGASAALGKPAQADMELGLATAPILYASEVKSSLKPLIERRFKNDGDVQKAVATAQDTDCVEKSYKLAEFHAQKGIDALMRFPESAYRDALARLMHLVLTRKS